MQHADRTPPPPHPPRVGPRRRAGADRPRRVQQQLEELEWLGAPAVITMQSTAFTSPTPVKAGATVTIKNNDPSTHTVTADDGTSFNVSVDARQDRDVHGAEHARGPTSSTATSTRTCTGRSPFSSDGPVGRAASLLAAWATRTFETIRYEVDGPVATITLARPDAANAQNSQLIYELDAAFDRAEADDDVRVVVLAAEGKHFSAGHDLKELLAGEEHWAAMRDTPEGKLAHEQTMYFDKLVRIRDFRKITIAAVQGTCSAAGLMLACDVRPDRRGRRRPLLQPGAAHVGGRRGAAHRAVGARAAQGQGVPLLRGDVQRRGSRALRARQPRRAARRPRRRGARRWPTRLRSCPRSPPRW